MERVERIVVVKPLKGEGGYLHPLRCKAQRKRRWGPSPPLPSLQASWPPQPSEQALGQ